MMPSSNFTTKTGRPYIVLLSVKEVKEDSWLT